MNTQDQKEFIKGTPARFSAIIGKIPTNFTVTKFGLKSGSWE